MKSFVMAIALLLALILPARAVAPGFVETTEVSAADRAALDLINEAVSLGGFETQGAAVGVGSGTLYEIYRYRDASGNIKYNVLGTAPNYEEAHKLLEAYSKKYDMALWKREFEKHYATVIVLPGSDTGTVNVNGNISTMTRSKEPGTSSEFPRAQLQTHPEEKTMAQAMFAAADEAFKKRTMDVLLLNRSIMHLDGDMASLAVAGGEMSQAPDGDYTLLDHSMMNVVRGHVVWGLPTEKTPGVMMRMTDPSAADTATSH
jgi:hypothetical protein